MWNKFTMKFKYWLSIFIIDTKASRLRRYFDGCEVSGMLLPLREGEGGVRNLNLFNKVLWFRCWVDRVLFGGLGNYVDTFAHSLRLQHSLRVWFPDFPLRSSTHFLFCNMKQIYFYLHNFQSLTDSMCVELSSRSGGMMWTIWFPCLNASSV